MSAASLVFAVAACGSGDDTSSNFGSSGPEAGADASKADASTANGDGATAATDGGSAGDGTTDDAGVLSVSRALLRFAHWSADAPAIDFCLAPHGTGAFQGPVLWANAAAIDDAGVVDAGTGALTFPLTSAYILVDPGQYDARVVAGGPGDCSASILDATNLPAVSGGGLATIALLGLVYPQGNEPTLQVHGFVDDLASSSSAAFGLRAINAAPDAPGVDVGVLTGTAFHPTFVGVTFGGTNLTGDANHYLPSAPFVNITVAAAASAPTLVGGATGSVLASAPGVYMRAGRNVTIVVVGTAGVGTMGASGSLTQLVECVDGVGAEGDCQLISN